MAADTAQMAADTAQMAADTTDPSTYDASLTGLVGLAANATSSLAPSPRDLVMLLPRLVGRLGDMASYFLPQNIVSSSKTDSLPDFNISEAVIQQAQSWAAAAKTTADAAVDGKLEPRSFLSEFGAVQVRNFGGIFSYMTSRWALSCLAAAVILNRTAVYAASRRNLNLQWYARLAIRIVPVMILLFLARATVQAIRCQTSPHYAELKFGKRVQLDPFDFAEDGGLLYRLSTWLLPFQSDLEACSAVDMISLGQNDQAAYGSMPLMWTAFLAMSLSKFAETLSCTVQGLPMITETGMSLFEHSLAFAEAEALVGSHEARQYVKRKLKNIMDAMGTGSVEATNLVHVPRRLALMRRNTSPEILLMILLSTCNHLSNQILGIFGVQARFRLASTAVWGLTYMLFFIWGSSVIGASPTVEAGMMRFPTVCLVGFIPHILVLLGIAFCTCIYGLAMMLAVLSPPQHNRPRATSWRERLSIAHNNMQANVQLSNLRLHRHEDFYTALLRVGFTMLVAASEAVYLNEGRHINIGQWTWLEEERLNELVRATGAGRRADLAVDAGLTTSGDTAVLTSTEEPSGGFPGRQKWVSGYSKERTTKILKGKPPAVPSHARDGIGAMQRGGRYVLAFSMLAKTFWLITGWMSLHFFRLLSFLGIRYRPRWLRKTRNQPDAADPDFKQWTDAKSLLDYWLLSAENRSNSDISIDADIEADERRRLLRDTGLWGARFQAELDSRLYAYFASGGSWGECDTSGEYQAPADLDDVTSVISMASSSQLDLGTDDEEWMNSGRRTPTQDEPFPLNDHQDRMDLGPEDSTLTTDQPLSSADLIRLLDPKDTEDRNEARMLAMHLASAKTLTRSQYARRTASSAAQLLTSSRHRPPGFVPSNPDGQLTAVEEATVLEYLILRHRGRSSSKAASSHLPASSTSAAESGHIHSSSVLNEPSSSKSAPQANPSSSAAPPHVSGSAWQDGADGLGAGGPVCVVCQSAPRTILAWPCRCLSLCEDCRVSLAMNNFGSCVCCRQEVVGFSRLYVP